MISNGDCLTVIRQMRDNTIDCIITSPPYWGLRDYGADGQIGIELNRDYCREAAQRIQETKK